MIGYILNVALLIFCAVLMLTTKQFHPLYFVYIGVNFLFVNMVIAIIATILDYIKGNKEN